MTRIGIISDTHGFLDEAVFKHFENCDEVWHGGDFGSIENANKIITGQTGKGHALLKGVYGNIDGNDVRTIYPEQLIFMCEGVKVMMRHIGGSPPKQNAVKKRGNHQSRKVGAV